MLNLNSDKVKEHFNSLYKSIKNSKNFEKLSLKELMWLVYKQACCDCGATSTEISMEEVKDFVDRALFLSFVESCLTDPQTAEKLPQNDFVKVTYKCTPEDRKKCVAYPDRCEDVGGDGENCTAILNLSKLCGIESNQIASPDDKILSQHEIKQLVKAIEETEKA